PQELSGNSSTGSGLANFIQMLNGGLNGAEQWNDNLNYYLSEGLSIGTTGSLTIRPGAIVKMGAGATFRDGGQLFAQGTDAAPIIFDSFKHDSAGGDTNGDGAASIAGPGDWDALVVTGTGA